MIEVRGTHGTTATRAESIRKSGFWISDGERGFGVYFWRENAYAMELAMGWYFNALSHRDSVYKNDKDKQCTIITALISAGNDEWIDLTDPDTEDTLIHLYKRGNYENTRIASKLYEEYYHLTEEELGIKIKLIQTRVYAPVKVKEWPTQPIGMPVCYVVRDNTCISIDRFKKLDQRETLP
jgi:hypothetical protein